MYKIIMRSLKKLKTELPYNPAIPLLGICPEKTIIQKIHVPQYSLQHYLLKLRHGSTLNVLRWTDREDMVHMHNGILLSHKKNEVMPFAAIYTHYGVYNLGVPWWSRGWHHAPSAGDLGSIPDQGTRSHIPHAGGAPLRKEAWHTQRRDRASACN